MLARSTEGRGVATIVIGAFGLVLECCLACLPSPREIYKSPGREASMNLYTRQLTYSAPGSDKWDARSFLPSKRCPFLATGPPGIVMLFKGISIVCMDAHAVTPIVAYKYVPTSADLDPGWLDPTFWDSCYIETGEMPSVRLAVRKSIWAMKQ